MSRTHEPLAALEADLLGRGRKPRTVYLFTRTAKALLDHAGKPVSRIKAEDVRAYLAQRSLDGISKTSQTAEVVHLHVFFRALIEAELVAHDPTEGLDVRRGEHPPQHFMSREGVRDLLNGATEKPRVKRMPHDLEHALGLRSRACIELLYGLAARASEIARLLVVDVRLAEGSVLVKRSKGGESRPLPLPPAALPHVEAYLREGRPRLVRPEVPDHGRLLLSRYGKPLTSQGIWVVVMLAAKKAGVRAFPHALRRSAATHMTRDGITVESVRQILGHRHLTTTMLYLDVSREDARRAVETLEGVHPEPVRTSKSPTRPEPPAS
jgi:site-specific recombinase XerD